jgi:hypothetical protein
MNQYYASKGNILQSFPESYVLHSPDDFQRFVKRLRDGGIDEPWVLKQPTVNQGKGIEIVGPNSPRLQEILKEGRPFNDGRLVAQKYICDELTYSGRKFDFRIFWMVASVDPLSKLAMVDITVQECFLLYMTNYLLLLIPILVVLYQTQHNYVRIGHANYDETDFSNTKSHLTTHTFGANEGKATWDEFRVYIEEFHSLQGYRLSHIKDPFLHLENQVKTVISNLVDAFKNITFHRRGITAQNAFSWHAADMIMDNDLDVYIIEATDGPGKDEDYDFRIVMHNTIFGDMIDIVEEISRRQEKRIPLDIHQMENDGVFGSYEVVYNDGWMFEYDFDRLPKQGCSISKAAKAGSRQVVVPKDISEKTRIKADLTALPKLPADVPFKTFFLQGRTGQSGEPIARSLRSKGWIPVDDRNSAQLIFEKLRTPTFPQTLHPWQFYNQFPDESDFFGLSNRGRKICNPLLYNGRQFRVKVYWLVLSIDPLIVFYHDGYMDIPHSEQDLYEFLPQNSSESPVWRGSWMGLEYHINATISSISQENSTAHVKNQMKSSLVGVAENFESYIQEKLGGAKIPLPKSFGIYTASFEIDRDLNTLLVDVSVLDIPSEGYQYIVDMHDDLFGSAFNILEKLNGTSSSSDFSIQQLKSAVDPSRYELLVNRAENERWNFEYPGGFKAAICS